MDIMIKQQNIEITDIPYITNISYEEFVDNFLSKNIPCLLSEVYTRSWKSRQEWICNGKPSFYFLEKSFGEAIVPVADCNKIEYQSHPKQTMPLKDFLNYWKNRDNDVSSANKSTVCWYLKDWHFCKSFPHHKAYSTPLFFQSDWLNEFWDKWSNMQDDYRFVYMGPKGTWTPFHADVFRSYSWSANICGHKKWILYPPGAEKHLTDKNGNLVFDLRSPDLNDRKKFPSIGHATKPLIVEQKEGEIIFVPSSWYHQVINEEDTISINHNWINGLGISRSWNHLKEELKLVEKSIADCREMDNWTKQCQIILKANSGMNYEGFFSFLCSISAARIHFIKTLLPEVVNLLEVPTFILDEPGCSGTEATLAAQEKMFDTLELSLFDLKQVRNVLQGFKINKDVDEKLKENAACLYVYISKIISIEA